MLHIDLYVLYGVIAVLVLFGPAWLQSSETGMRKRDNILLMSTWGSVILLIPGVVIYGCCCMGPGDAVLPFVRWCAWIVMLNVVVGLYNLAVYDYRRPYVEPTPSPRVQRLESFLERWLDPPEDHNV